MTISHGASIEHQTDAFHMPLRPSLVRSAELELGAPAFTSHPEAGAANRHSSFATAPVPDIAKAERKRAPARRDDQDGLRALVAEGSAQSPGTPQHESSGTSVADRDGSGSGSLVEAD